MDSTSRPGAWQRIASACVRSFHAYANWLVGITWKRFALLSVLLLIAAGILSELPPFSWRIAEHFVEPGSRAAQKAKLAAAKKVSPAPRGGYEVTIDDHGVHIGPKSAASSGHTGSGAGTSGSSGKSNGASNGSSDSGGNVPPEPPEAPAAPEAGDRSGGPSVDIRLPKGADAEEIKAAVEEAKASVEEAIADAAEARQDALDAISQQPRLVSVRLGDYLPQTALLFIVASVIIKINYKGRIQAEVKAAQATETAESESLKRQVIEARMAAMQAQVEPHFLFNTLASIDHLIEVDPPRASVMQKNLIALLRASMPTMREVNAQGVGDLGRELAVVRPYLEILKVRMEERLLTEINVPDGLLSAEFPPMMIQSLVENAVKHGLEPKPDGGRLSVVAEIVHGNLSVTVADTGLGFGRAATAGTGVGLANIRERLELRYGRKAQLSVAENKPSGCRVTITVPYSTNHDSTHHESNATRRAA